MSAKDYQYFLFDWDGNLAQTLDIWLDACRIAIEKRGIHQTDEAIGASFGAFIKHMQEWGVTDPEIAMKEADQIARERLPKVELYPGALEVLEKLHERGKKVALITSSSHENVAHLLEKHGLTDLFQAIVAAGDVTQHKPHPEPLEKGLELLGGTKELAVMIGDSDKDLGAALNAGMDSVLFYPPEHKKFYPLESLTEHKPTYIFEDFRDILKLAQ